ncbi:hypothetical protein [Streptomyces sp. t39]|uniref:hypothetical protein n=1 Tax=Streptomyces sp. t39 TaxID=1828156 RepID=UPI0011CE03E6|nr:hypothetical protein [Streptomyces sp. t39]TXS48133.1 hypothetical protein EAO77_30565 [Streptomyces sp. t39]
MPHRSRFDQRAVALVELRGTRLECEMFEEALAERGWPVLEKRGTSASATTERRVWYTIEARFPGSPLNAVRGARERIEVVSDDLQLDLNVEAVDRVVRDPVDRLHWMAYRRPPVHPRTAPLPRLRRWSERWALWRAENMGSQDTGRLITATSASAAQHLAARPLPGATPPPAPVAARRYAGSSRRRPTRLGNRRQAARTFVWLFAFMVAAVWAGARITDRWAQGPGSWWGFALFVAALLPAMVAVARRNLPELPAPALAAAVTVLAAFGLGIGADTASEAPVRGEGSQVLTYVIAGFLVFNGIRLLVRQWTWQRTAPWLLPALLPVFFGLVPTAGLGLHTFYLEAFGLNLEDVSVPKAWQLVVSFKLMASMSLWLVALSLLGYMKHYHRFIKDRWLGTTALVAATFYLLVIGTLDNGVLPAGRAGEQAVAAAKAGRTPSPYFGIKPEWVCVQPVGEPEKIPVDGGVLAPSRPYVKVGDAQGTVVLWDAGAGKALKLPMNRLRIVPFDDRPPTCG